MTWTRPSDLPLGRVWRRFKGNQRNDAPAPSFQIRDVEERERQRCLQLMLDCFLKDEPLCKLFGVSSDPSSVSTIKSNWLQGMCECVSVACYTEDGNGNPGELVAVSLNLVECADDGPPDMEQQPGAAWQKLLSVLLKVGSSFNVFSHYGIDRYLTTDVLIVHPKYRGHNIGLQMFRATEDVGRACGLSHFALILTAATSQALATKGGYETLAELPYCEVIDPTSTGKAVIAGVPL